MRQTTVNRIIAVALGALLVLTSSCGVVRNSQGFYQPVKTQVLRVDGDGTVSVRATGLGRNRYYAIDNARRNALKDCIFKGYDIPSDAYMSKPLVMSVNAQEKYEQFFNAFFADKGDYEKFVSGGLNRDRKLVSNRKQKNDIQAKVTITLRVERAALKEYLKENGIK